MKKLLLLSIILLLSFTIISAQENQTNLYYFYGNGCIHCATVAESGILETISQNENINLTKYEIQASEENRQKYLAYVQQFEISQYNRGIPFIVIECSKSSTYLMGDNSIINKLENTIQTCPVPGNNNNGVSPTNPNAETITLGAVILAALIDSVNPCAFGVLIFLMLSLLKIGSSKRALKAGLIYSFVVFCVYFLAGLGIFRAIQSFTSITHYIYLASGILVLILGLWQFKDVFLPKFGPSLAISPKVKPLIENIIQKGTLPAIIFLGIIVSLFELPCTGGIYLGILTLMSINKTFAISYLLIYNLIFVLPLIILTIIVYKGTSPETLQKWTQGERKYMKLAAGIVLIVLGAYILFF